MRGLPLEGHDGEQGTDRELPEAGAGIEVGVCGVVLGLPDGECEGCAEDQAEDQYGGGYRLDADLLHQQSGDSEEHRPEQEDLTLNG